MLPFLACFVVSVISGYASELAARRGCCSLLSLRRVAQTLSELASAIALVLAGYSVNVYLAVLCMTVSVGLSGACSSGFAVNYLDVSPYYGGVLLGIGNTIATIPGIVAPIVAGAIIPTEHGADEAAPRAAWQEVFWIGFGVSVFGWGCWMLVATADVQPAIAGPVLEHESSIGINGGSIRVERASGDQER